jgi:hypothetical protein
MLTPPYVLEPVRHLLGGIALDPCTEPDNPTGADNFYCLPRDGCSLSWDAANVFCNPPYGEARARWVERCVTEGQSRPVVLLIPAHTETRVFQSALQACESVLFVKARLRFGVLRENRRQEAASHGSAIFGFGIDVAPLANLGTAMRRPTETSREQADSNAVPTRSNAAELTHCEINAELPPYDALARHGSYGEPR